MDFSLLPDNKPFGNGENKGPPWQPLSFKVSWKSRSDLDATPERSAANAGLTKTMKVKFDPKNPAIAIAIRKAPPNTFMTFCIGLTQICFEELFDELRLFICLVCPR